MPSRRVRIFAENWPSIPRVDVFDSGRCVACVPGRCVLLIRLNDVDEMMRNAAPLVSRHFVRADVKPPIDGCGIAADDFAPMPGREIDRERALARGCGTQNGQNGRTQDYNLKYASAATSASRISRPSCCVLLTILPGGHLVVEERHGEERLV